MKRRHRIIFSPGPPCQPSIARSVDEMMQPSSEGPECGYGTSEAPPARLLLPDTVQDRPQRLRDYAASPGSVNGKTPMAGCIKGADRQRRLTSSPTNMRCLSLLSSFVLYSVCVLATAVPRATNSSIQAAAACNQLRSQLSGASAVFFPGKTCTVSRS